MQITAAETPSVAIDSGQGTEFLAGICTDATAAGTFHLRWRRTGAALNTYTVTPNFTISATPTAGGGIVGGLILRGGALFK